MANNSIFDCRLCQNSKLRKVLNFKKISLGNNLQNKYQDALKAKEYPLALNQCKKCSHFQLNFSVDPKILYATNYTYLSRTGYSFVQYLKKNASKIIKQIKLKTNSLVLDIGSNDGTALSFYKEQGIKVCGIDPATKPAIIANKKKIFTYNNFFSNQISKKIIRKFGYPDLIISHNTLAHVEDIKQIFENIFNTLKKNGFFLFEVGYFKNVVENNLFDTIYHEHLDYHHANPLSIFLKRIGFSIIKISTNNIQGGSLKILCKKDGKINISKQAYKFLQNEKKTVLYNRKFLKNWEKIIYKNIKKINEYLLSQNIEHKNLYGYGAPTKCVLLIKKLKLNNKKIKGIIEDNPLKMSKYLPKTAIKIFSSKVLKKNKIYFLILFE